jgi:zinc protease
MPQLTDLLNKTIYRTHPYGRPRTGTEKSISSINKSDLIEWYRTLAVPPNFVLAVVGDVHMDEFIGQVEDLFSDSGPSSFNLPLILPELPLQKEREVHLERPGQQIHLMVGYLGADLKSPDNAVMTLIDTSLSGQGGRLFMELRDKQSLAYSVTAFRRPGLETGLFGIHLACDPKKFPVARKAIFRELERLKDEGLTKQELEGAKRYMLGSKAIGLQTNESQALNMALDELYGLGYDHLGRFVNEIKQVSIEDIKRVARKILVEKGFTLATVGPKQ